MESQNKFLPWLKGTFWVILITVILVFAGLVWMLFRQPLNAPRGLKGDFLKAVAVPAPQGEFRLWILTDGSFGYIQSTRSPGRMSIGRKCKFCKTWLFIYDPIRKQVLNKFKTDYRTIITQSWMARANGKIWVATGPYENNEPRLFAYDETMARLLLDDQSLVRKYPELGSGLVDIRMESEPDRFILSTKDGKVGLVLTLADEKLYANDSEFKKASGANSEEQATCFVLGSEGNGPRKKLYLATGARKRVREESFGFFLGAPSTVITIDNVVVQPITSNRVYIEGMIFFQDADSCLVLYQDAIGQTANRFLACVDAKGNEKWTAGPNELFKEMKLDLQKDPFSQIFLMKNNIGVSRTRSLVMLQLQGVGAIGFDFASGKKLWQIKF